MKRGVFRLAPVLAIAMVSQSPAQARDAAHPVIEGYGAITPAPDAANQPDQDIEYRVVFNVTAANKDPKVPNPTLLKVARYLNLLGSRGIRPDGGNIVAIVHGGATPLVLNDRAYGAAYGSANPNLPLIAALRANGVEIHVCSQALSGQKIERVDVASDVTIDLSAMTTLTTLQLKGYAIVPD